MTHDIFISYSSAQSDAAQAVCHLLEQHDIKCWMAPRNLTGGAEYGDVIEDAIKYSRAVVVLFSDTAARSRWVSGELNVAFEEQKPIIPFRLDETPLRGQVRVMLNQKHWIDAFPDYKTKFGDLVTAVASILGKEVAVAKPDPMAGGGVWSPAPQEEAGALSYEEGKALYDEHLYADALGLLADSALEGNAKAQHLISRMMYDCSSASGRGISQFDESHLQIIQQLVDAQLPCGYFAQHCFYYSADADCVVPKDYAKSFACLRKAPTDPYAMLRMGICYGFGLGTRVNLSLQLLWFKKALAAGVAEVCSYLGQHFQYADKGSDRMEKALEYYKRGVELGDRRCFLKLMTYYTNDSSLSDDEKISLCQHLCDQLVGMGDYIGYDYMGCLYYQLNDLDKAISCLKKAVANDVISAYGDLANILWAMNHREEAVKWAQNGILMGDKWSAGYLAFFMDHDTDNWEGVTAGIAHRLNQPELVSASRTLQIWSLYKVGYDATGSQDIYGYMAETFFGHQGIDGVSLAEVTDGLQALVDSNDLDACKRLVDLYGGRLAGFEHEADEALYAKYLQKAAELNDVDSKLELAQNYIQGTHGFLVNVVKALKECGWVARNGNESDEEKAVDLVVSLLQGDEYRDYLDDAERRSWVARAGWYMKDGYLQDAQRILETDDPHRAYALAEKAADAGNVVDGDLVLIDYLAKGVGCDSDREQAQRKFDDIKDRLTFAHLPSIDKVCRSLVSPDEVREVEGVEYSWLQPSAVQRYLQYFCPLVWVDVFPGATPAFGRLYSLARQHQQEALASGQVDEDEVENLVNAYANLCMSYKMYVASLADSELSPMDASKAIQALCPGSPLAGAAGEATSAMSPLGAIATIRRETCKAMLTLLPYTDQGFSLTLSDEDFLTCCEALTDNADLQLFFISVVEIHIELEAIMIDINKAVPYVENMANMRLCDCDHAGGDGN